MSEALFSGMPGVRVMEVGSEERRNVWSGLRYDEVVDIEKLADSRQRGFAVVVGSLFP